MEKNWYVIHTYSGYENKVKANLERRVESMGMEDKIFRILVPTEEELEIRDGKRKITKKKIFPGYVIVEMILTDDSWYVVTKYSRSYRFCRFGFQTDSVTRKRDQTDFTPDGN